MNRQPNETMVQLLQRLNRESEAAAVELHRQTSGGVWRNLRRCFNVAPPIRRQARLRISLGLPGVVRLLYRYILRGGFAGSLSFDEAAIQATYEHWIEMKARERERDWREQTDALVVRLLEEQGR